MSCSYKADDIGIDPEEGIEETIAEKMIVLANTIANGERYWFDDGRFNNYVDVASDEDLIELLEYFDDIDMDMEHVYYEASIVIESLSDTNYKFASLIENGSTLQLGIGKIPDAVAKSLKHKKDLGFTRKCFRMEW